MTTLRITPWSGAYEPQPMFRKGRNKGVVALRRSIKRQQAVARNEQTAPENRSTKRARRLVQS